MDLQTSYDRVAEDYAREFQHELAKKPFDCKMLDWLIEKVNHRGTICDLGCGPGQIANYLHSRGTKTCGIDLSDEMVKEASRINPQIRFQQGNMLDLHDVPDHSLAGIAAFYSIIHIPRESLPEVLRELRRVLMPGGVLLLTFHIGQEVIHRDEWWGKQVFIDFIFYETNHIKDSLRTAGFQLNEVIERDPYPPEVEYQSRRAYIFATNI